MPERGQDDCVNEWVDAAVDLHEAAADPAEHKSSGWHLRHVPMDQDVHLPLSQVGDVGNEYEENDTSC